MGFDAGKITAHLDLNTEGFNEKADEAEKKKEELGRDVEPKVTLDTDEAVKKADELQVKKEELAKAVETPIGADTKKFDADALEVEAVKRELGSEVDVKVKIDRDAAKADAAATRQALVDAFGLDNIGQYSFIQKAIEQGKGPADTALAVESMFGHEPHIAHQMVAEVADFQMDQADRLAPAARIAAAPQEPVGSDTPPARIEQARLAVDASEVEAVKKDLASEVIIPVKADTTDLRTNAEKIEEFKRARATPVDIPVTVDTKDLAPGAMEVEETKAGIAKPVDVKVLFDQAAAEREAAATGRAARDEFLLGFSGNRTDLTGLQSMFDQGLDTKAMARDLKAFDLFSPTNIADARKMVAEFGDYQVAEAERVARETAYILATAANSANWHSFTSGELTGAVDVLRSLPSVPGHYPEPIPGQAAIGPGSGGGSLASQYSEQWTQTRYNALGPAGALGPGSDPGTVSMERFLPDKAGQFATDWAAAIGNLPQPNWAPGGQQFPALGSGETFGNWVTNMATDASGEQIALGRGTSPWGDGTAGTSASWPVNAIDASARDTTGTTGTGGWPFQAGGYHQYPTTDGSKLAEKVAAAGFNMDGTPIGDSNGESAKAGKSEAQKFADAWKAGAKKGVQDAQYSIFQGLEGNRTGVGSAWKDIFQGKSGIAEEISKAAKKMGVDVGKDFTDTMSKEILDKAKSAASFGGGGGFIGSITGALSSGAQAAVSGAGSVASSVGGMSPLATTAAVAAPLIVPILGAAGLATGGILAGTGIGTAGLLAGLLPGVMDLMKGYGAYSAQQTFDAAGGATGPNAAQNVATLQQATHGDNAGNLAVASSIGDLLHGGNGFLSGLEVKVNPDILNFLDSLKTALPTIEPFFTKAVDSLSGFFDRVDKGMNSKGFKDFMKKMSDDVGPIMDKFGTFVDHAAGAIGGFLELFGGKVAQKVGDWFDNIAGKLDTFLNNAQISPGFMQGMTDAFNFLWAAVSLVWDVLTKLANALAPIGENMMKFLTPALDGLKGMVDAIPENVVTGIAAGIGLIGGALLILSADPLTLFVAGILALGFAVAQVKQAMALDLTPMTNKDITQAAWGNATDPSKRTPAETAAIDKAKLRGMSPTDVSNTYGGLLRAEDGTGKPNISPTAAADWLATHPENIPQPATPRPYKTGIGTGDPTAVSISPQQVQDLRNAATPPSVSGWTAFERAVGPILGTVGGLFKRFAEDALGGWTKMQVGLTKIYGQMYQDMQNWLGNFNTFSTHTHKNVMQWGHDLVNDLDIARHSSAHVFDDITGGISNWVTNSLPHAFDQVRHTTAHGVDNIRNGVSDWVTQSLPHAFEGAYNGVSNWVTNSLPHAFDNVRHAVASAFDGAENWLEGAGIKIVNGLIRGINNGIDKINGVTAHLPFSAETHIPDIGFVGAPASQAGSFGVLAPGQQPAYADGGWVTAAPGAPQLAVVHGGEFVMSQAMIAAGAMGGSFGTPASPAAAATPAVMPAATPAVQGHYADGGWVTAPMGTPQLAIVHGGEFVMSRAMIAGGAMGGTTTVQINVDARGSANPAAVTAAAQGGVNATIPALRRAIVRSAA